MRAAELGDTREMWRLARFLGGAGRGPRGRLYRAPAAKMPTEQEWNDLPEPGEHRKHSAAEKRNERYIPAPDSLLEKARQEQEVVHSLDARQMQTGGMETPMTGLQTPFTDLKSIGEARGAVLSVKLDQMSDSVEGQTVVDPKG